MEITLETSETIRDKVVGLLNTANGSPCWKAFAKFGVCNNNQPEDSEDVLFINVTQSIFG